MEIDIKNINANEILDYLNDLANDEFEDLSCQRPFIFESQGVFDELYRITFSCYFNNWGTDQLIEDNQIDITKDSIRVMLNEPFDGDGSSDSLEEVLIKWLPTHEFSTTYKDDFKALLKDSIQLLSNCQYGNLSTLEEVSKKITKAKTLIK